MDEEAFIREIQNQLRNDVYKSIERRRREALERKMQELHEGEDYASRLMRPDVGLRRRFRPFGGGGSALQGTA